MTAAEFARLIRNAKPRASGDGWWDGCCPAHEDKRSSLSFRDGDRGLVIQCHAGCAFEKIATALGRKPADFFKAMENGHRAGRIVATYTYTDERAAALYDVVRFDPKDFRCRRADGTWSMAGVRRVPYRLHELAEAARVYIPEGEKDADALRAIGLIATCNEGGAGKWREEHTRALVAAAVPEAVVLRDNDAAGASHQRSVVTACAAAGLRVRRLDLPGVPPKGDVSDYIAAQRAAGRTDDEIRAALLALADGAPVFDPNEDAAGAPLTAPPEPQITLTAEDGTWSWPDGAGIAFARVSEGSRGVSAEVSVTWQGRELHYGSLNLLSTRSREDVVRKVTTTAPADTPWREHLDLSCRQMVARLREGAPVVRLTATPRTPEQYLMRSALAAGDTTVTFGPGGSGKSLYALLLEIAVATGCTLPGGLRATRTCPVLVLDWESSRSAHEARLYELCRGLGITPPTTLYYKRMSGPLTDSVRQIRADVARLGVGLVRVDSLALAAGREPEGADASTRTMNDLRTLGDHVTRHVIAHVAKSGLDVQGTGHVYGSVFNENIPRNVFEIRKDADPADDELTLMVFHRKANESRLHPPFGLRFILSPEDTRPEDKTITVESCSLRDAPPDLLARVSLSQQIKAVLAHGGKSIPALAVELNAKEGSVKQAVHRLRDRRPPVVVRLPADNDKGPILWGLAQR